VRGKEEKIEVDLSTRDRGASRPLQKGRAWRKVGALAGRGSSTKRRKPRVKVLISRISKRKGKRGGVKKE